MHKHIFLSSPHLSGYEQQFIQEALASNWVAPLGPFVNRFEHEIAAYVGKKGAVALSSGTAALHLALKLAGVGPGDEVFCSTLTFAASTFPILYEQAVPVLIDSEPDSWNLSPIALERAFQEAVRRNCLPRAVIAVNLYGQSADLDPILELCNRYDVPVIEDAAESLGATYKGKPSGSKGRYGVFSFNGNKIITTSGGGMLVSDDLKALDKARFWATQARDPAEHYQHSEIGYNYRMSNVLAAIGVGQLKVLEDRIAARRQVFQNYFDSLGALPGYSFMPESAFGRATRWLSVMEVEPQQAGHTARQLLQCLAAANIEARPVWKPMHLQPVFAHCRYYPHGERSVSDGLFEKGLCLPSGSNLTAQEQIRVIEQIKKVSRR